MCTYISNIEWQFTYNENDLIENQCIVFTENFENSMMTLPFNMDHLHKETHVCSKKFELSIKIKANAIESNKIGRFRLTPMIHNTIQKHKNECRIIIFDIDNTLLEVSKINPINKKYYKIIHEWMIHYDIHPNEYIYNNDFNGFIKWDPHIWELFKLYHKYKYDIILYTAGTILYCKSIKKCIERIMNEYFIKDSETKFKITECMSSQLYKNKRFYVIPKSLEYVKTIKNIMSNKDIIYGNIIIYDDNHGKIKNTKIFNWNTNWFQNKKVMNKNVDIYFPKIKEFNGWNNDFHYHFPLNEFYQIKCNSNKNNKLKLHEYFNSINNENV